MDSPTLADVTLSLRDTPTGVVVHTTFKPALGQRLTPAQALALDLATQASHRAEVVHMQVQEQVQEQRPGEPGDTEAAQTHTAPHTLNLPLDLPQ